MGLIKAAIDSVKSGLQDQYLEFFTCDSLGDKVLVKNGAKKMVRGGNKGTAEVISNGSKIAVPEGTALLLVDNGRVVDFTTDAGMYTWDSSSAPSCFGSSGFLDGAKKSCIDIWNRIKSGGEIPQQQRVYFVNMLDIPGNAFGTPAPIPYDDPTYRGIYVRMNGSFSFKVEDPVALFTHLAGNVADEYPAEKIVGTVANPGQLRNDFLMYLGDAMNAMGAGGENIQYNRLPSNQVKLAKIMNDIMDDEWLTNWGIVISDVAVRSITPDDDSRKRIQDFDNAMMYGNNPNMLAAHVATQEAAAKVAAGSNAAGAMNGIMGVGMMGGMGGMNSGTNAAFDFLGKQQAGAAAPAAPAAAAPAAAGWTCACGNSGNTGKFCGECGKPMPQQTAGWAFACGHAGNTGKVCGECGKPKPSGEWTCSCGHAGNTGKFCGECGKPQA